MSNKSIITKETHKISQQSKTTDSNNNSKTSAVNSESSPYHLSTIGIDSVFASINYPWFDPGQQNHHTVAAQTEDDDVNIKELHEITGVLKSRPEDFIVREIGSGIESASKDRGKGGMIADLTDSFTLPSDHHGNVPAEQSDTTSTPAGIHKPTDQYPRGALYNNSNHNNSSSTSSNGSGSGSLVDPTDTIPVPIVHTETPHDAIKTILSRCIQKENVQESPCQGLELYQKLEKLSQNAMLLMLQDGEEKATKGTDSYHDEEVIIPPIVDDGVIIQCQPLEGDDDDIASPTVNGKKGVARNRCTFHRTLKIAFPLLKSSTLTVQEGNAKDSDACRLVKVEIDDTFIGLVPYLLYPQRDVPSLYEFRNKGCPDTAVHGRIEWKARKKRCREDPTSQDKIPCQKDPSSTDHQVHLYLKPSIQRDERKNIHHLIAKACREFETGTKNDVKCDSPDKDERTTIIIVKWSRQALKNNLMRKKRKLAKGNTMEKFHTLCILKKRRQEHSSVISLLASALKCRQSDIGLAGRKDTLAVTYQFCTLRHISPFRARRANESLKEKGIELGNFQRVSWLLNPGHLQGNYFEIIVRNVKRIEKVFDNDDDSAFRERLVPCESRYIDSAVERVRQGGFVNFFGEQRVGAAGPADEVGVRSSEVGRAMLQGDFSGAIDLLMKGRNKSRAGDFVESEEVRLMRATYFETGDIDKTLSAMPRNSYLGRERTLLQGLKRYGRDRPLEVLKCLNFSTRMFYINAYQALVWNKMASERIKRYGINPVPGDLYMEDNSNEVKVVVDEAIVNIKQVVLPLPGYSVLYPENAIGDMYQEIMKQDGVTFEKDVVPEATGKGSYRSLVTLCESLEWENVSQSEPVTAIKFKFSLTSGSYATMCLREIMATTALRTS